MSGRIKKIIKYILSIGLAAVLLYFSFRSVKWDDFMAGLRSCRWEFILLSMVLGVLSFWIRGVRWRRLLFPFDPSLSRVTCFNAVNIGYIANFVFPRIGEFVRCGIITQNSCNEGNGKKASYDKVLGTVVMERAWDMLMLLLLLFLLLFAMWGKFGDFFVRQIWQPLSSELNFSVWWLVLTFAFLCVAGLAFLWHFRQKSKFCAKLWSIVNGMVQGFASCLMMKDKTAFVIETVMIWAIYWLMACATMWAVPMLDGLGIVDALFLSLVGSIGWVIPVPGGFGSFHFIVSLALEAIYGIPFGMGIVFATLSHESQAITMAVFGGGSYIHEVLKRRK